MADTTAAAADVQDALRSVRSFISILGGNTQDQSWAGTDSTATNAPYQYQTIGSYGVAIEGAPVSTGQAAALGGGAITIPISLFAMAALAMYLAFK